MKPPDATSLLKLAGGSIDPRWLAALVVVVPIVAVLIVWLRKRQADAKKAAAAPPPTTAAALDPEAKRPAPAMREAWNAFVKDLPSNYRRSILNFEHFVVLGDAVHDKPRVADVYTDWNRLEKQFVRSKPDNQDLPLFIGSRTVLMLLPVKVLDMKDEACKAALTKLWKPLYQRKTPMVVVHINAQKLVDGRLDEVQEMAENIRAKINLLSSIRGQSIEVRVLLSRLDTFLAKDDAAKGYSSNGYDDVAEYCLANGMALRMRLAGGTTADVAWSTWVETIRGQLPRMLATLSTDAYGRVLRFLRASERLLTPVRHFCAALFNPDTMFPNPLRGELFLASTRVGLANPFAQGDRTPGPDPRLMHQLIAAGAVGASLAFLGGTFLHQQSEWIDANKALDRYRPDNPIREREQDDREHIMAFTQERTSVFDTFPDYFATPRLNMRQAFSAKIRESLLLPLLERVVETGKATQDHTPLPHARSLYVLGLIHSDKSDPLVILNVAGKDRNPRLDLWSSMTGIEPGLITDYLTNTDIAYRTPVDVRLQGAPVDEYDREKVWLDLINDIDDAMYANKEDFIVRAIDDLKLTEFQERAVKLEPHVRRLEHAGVTLDILPALEHAGRGGQRAVDAERSSDEETSTEKKLSDGLVRAYDGPYKEFLESYSAFRSVDTDELRALLTTILATASNANDSRGLLINLVGRLKGFDQSRRTTDNPWLVLAIGRDVRIFNKHHWLASMRESRVHNLIRSFITNAPERDIFFDDRNEPPAVLWNAAGRSSAVFEGRVAIAGRNTREAYDQHVRRPVLDLALLFDGANVNPDDRESLKRFVDQSVDRYARGLQANMIAFIKGFHLSVSNPEELRVALTQMSADTGGTSFDEFLGLVDRNTRLNEKSPKTGLVEPMLQSTVAAMADFNAWHGVASQDQGAPKIIEYKKILQQLLVDLGGAADGGGDAAGGVKPAAMKSGEGDSKRTSPTLESELTPSGRVYLSSILDAKGAYSGLIRNWIAGTNLPREQQWPFVLPISHVETTGRQDIENTVERALNRELMLELQQLVNRFPFDKKAREDASPQELTKLFHPDTGLVYDYFRRYLEPLSDFGGPDGFRRKPSVGGVRISKSIYDFLNASALLSARLWDEKGEPRPLEYSFVTVPFGKAPNDETALTLVYLNVGSGSLFNFNQQQSGKVLSLEWDKSASSQVGVQLTNTETKDNLFPQPINRSGSNFSLLRLLMAAEQPPSAVKEPATAQLYSWDITVQQKQSVRVQFVLKKDPWETFTLRPYVLQLVNR